MIDLRDGARNPSGGVRTLEVPRLPSAAVDATAGRLDLAGTADDVTSTSVIGLTIPPWQLAERLALPTVGGFTHGSRWGVLVPSGPEWSVVVLADGTEGLAQNLLVGRLHERVAERWAARLDGRTVRVVVFVEATPGLAGVDVRFLPSLLTAGAEPTWVLLPLSRVELDEFGPPTAPAAWYPDPLAVSDHRWWDGSRWTLDTA